ncbi:MAG: formylglycine-generating enzyme family protein [Spirochaetaceae bacterium]|nr:formylglycine-generating enzyme family protein [Spirochaetaceae bacterium]
MKKWLTTVLIVVSIVLGIIGYDNPSGLDNGGTQEERFVLIHAGTFQMGSKDGYDDNKPVHEVKITKSFYMGKYEITQAEYEKYCSYGSDSPSLSYGDGDNYPAYYVSWYDALVYCNKRSIAEGLTPCYSIKDSTNPEEWGELPTSWDDPLRDTWDVAMCDFNANGYRLPTEAEWEYAARAGDNTVDSLTYSGTSDVNKLGDYAWYYDSANDNTHEVGTKLPNAFGLYDMTGNVYEWCWNWFTSEYDENTEGGSDPTGTSAGSGRVYRGGSWSNDSDGCAVSYRYYDYPNFRDNNYLGFRVVRQAN